MRAQVLVVLKCDTRTALLAEVVPEELAAEPASEEPLITEPATNEGDEQQPEQPMEAEAAAEPEAHPAPEVAAIPEANGAEPAVEQAPTAEVQPATQAAVPSVQVSVCRLRYACQVQHFEHTRTGQKSHAGACCHKRGP